MQRSNSGIERMVGICSIKTKCFAPRGLMALNVSYQYLKKQVLQNLNQCPTSVVHFFKVNAYHHYLCFILSHLYEYKNEDIKRKHSKAAFIVIVQLTAAAQRNTAWKLFNIMLSIVMTITIILLHCTIPLLFQYFILICLIFLDWTVALL